MIQKLKQLATVLILVLITSIAVSDDGDKPYDEIPPYDYPFIDEEKHHWYWFFWQRVFPGVIPVVELAFVVEPANNLYWKTETYDVYLGVPRNGVIWDKSEKTLEKVDKNLKIEAKGKRFTVYKKLSAGDKNFYLIKPLVSEAFIDAKNLKLMPLDAGNYELYKNFYNEYEISLKLKKRSLLCYNTTFSFPRINAERVGYVSDIPEDIVRRYTQLPYKELPEEIKNLKAELYDPKLNIYNQSLKVARYILANIRYDIEWWKNSSDWRNEDVAVWTLKNKRGICTHFATTYVVLLRSMKIPSRLAVGYAGGKTIGNKTYIFTSFAHAWAEVYMPPYGWVPVEVTGSYQLNENLSNKSFMMMVPVIPFEGNVRPDLHEMYLIRLDQLMQLQWNLSLNISQWNLSWWNFSQLNLSWWNFSYWNFSWWNLSYLNLSQWNFSQWNISQLNLSQWNYSNYSANISSNQTQNYSIENGTSTSVTIPKNFTSSRSLISKVIKAVSDQNNLLILILILFLIFFGVSLYKIIPKKKVSPEKKPALKPRKLRYVDIIKVIERCEQFGREGRYVEGAIYAYIELASFLCYKLKLEANESKTPREFQQEVEKSKLVNLDTITSVFEKARYAERIEKEEFYSFLKALKEIAEILKEK